MAYLQETLNVDMAHKIYLFSFLFFFFLFFFLGHPLLPDFFLDQEPEDLAKQMEEHGELWGITNTFHPFLFYLVIDFHSQAYFSRLLS